jgi:HNH endonuclease
LSAGYVGADLRRLVAARAERLCEYCLIHEDDTFYGCEVDHIISEKHGGPTQEDNLAYACLFCNRFKGSDIASLEPGTDRLVRLFNPRLDLWTEHFVLEDGVTILPRTSIGEATVRLLGLNHGDRLAERQAMQQVGRYPTAAALRRCGGI